MSATEDDYFRWLYSQKKRDVEPPTPKKRKLSEVLKDVEHDVAEQCHDILVFDWQIEETKKENKELRTGIEELYTQMTRLSEENDALLRRVSHLEEKWRI
jgi:FtsZ-binding cell division protein ZapB